jgi:hypothetical protein
MMDVSADTNLIPPRLRQYPVQSFVPEKAIVVKRDSIERQYRFQQPHGADAIHRRYDGNRYDATRCLQFPDDYQVGRLVDVYA